MRIMQIATPHQSIYAAFAVKNKKGAWVIEKSPVLFFGLIPITEGPEGKEKKFEATIEPLVYNFQSNGASVATSHKNFLGLEILTLPTSPHKDWAKELIAYVSLSEKQEKQFENIEGVHSSNPKEVKNEAGQG